MALSNIRARSDRLLDDDVAVTKRVIAAQPGPVVLFGHSYGGVVITDAGNDLAMKIGCTFTL